MTTTTEQVTHLGARIATLTEHLRTHPRDFATRRSLLTLVGRRRRLARYARRQAQRS